MMSHDMTAESGCPLKVRAKPGTGHLKLSSPSRQEERIISPDCPSKTLYHSISGAYWRYPVLLPNRILSVALIVFKATPS